MAARDRIVTTFVDRNPQCVSSTENVGNINAANAGGRGRTNEFMEGIAA